MPTVLSSGLSFVDVIHSKTNFCLSRLNLKTMSLLGVGLQCLVYIPVNS